MSTLREDNKRLSQSVAEMRAERRAQDRKIRDLEHEPPLRGAGAHPDPKGHRARLHPADHGALDEGVQEESGEEGVSEKDGGKGQEEEPGEDRMAQKVEAKAHPVIGTFHSFPGAQRSPVTLQKFAADPIGIGRDPVEGKPNVPKIKPGLSKRGARLVGGRPGDGS